MTINQSNKFITDTIDKALPTLAGYSKMQGEVVSPIAGTADALRTMFKGLSANLVAINSDTTLTKDATTDKMEVILGKAYDTALTKFNNDLDVLDTLIKGTESELFSKKMVVDQSINALLGNSTILGEMRADFRKYAEDDKMATLLNTFNKYGVLGDATHREQVATFLDMKYTAGVVAEVNELKSHQKIYTQIGALVRTTHQYLSSDTTSLAGIRKMKVQ